MADEDLTSIGSALSIDTLSLNIDVNIGKSTAKLRNFTNQLEKTTSVVNNSLAPLSKLQNTLSTLVTKSNVGSATQNISSSSITKETQAIDNATKTTTNAINKLGVFATIGKLYFFFNYFKRMGQSISGMIQKGVDFNETLNLWQVSMRGNLTEARQFVAEMNQAYGISEALVMKSEATFNNMLSSLGTISSKASSQISEALVSMSIDFSSLYNVSLDDAMTKFQAVLAGQVRPIRSVSGYDITENTLNQMLKQIGSSQTVRSLSETEKRLLRIYAVFQQMGASGALGDMSKTLTSNANQLRIMQSQVEETETWIGNIVSYWMQSSGILVTLNSYLITAKEIIKGIAYEMGYSEPTFINGIFESASDANDEVETLSNSLMGFDKFNVLSSSSTSSNLGIDEKLLAAIENYSSVLDNTTNPAMEKANELLKEMGLNFEYTVTAGEQVKTFANEDEAKAWVSTLSEADQATASIVRHLGGSNLVSIKNNIETIGKVLVSVIGFFIAKKVGAGIGNIVLRLQEVNTSLNAIEMTKLTNSVSLINNQIPLTVMQINQLKTAMWGLASTGLGLLIQSISSLTSSWSNLNNMQKLVGVFTAIASAAMLAAGAIAAMKIAVSPIAAKIAIGAGLLATLGTVTTYFTQLKSVSSYATGGFVPKGQLFIANESGAEMVGSMDGKTAVANNSQITTSIERAAYNGFAQALSRNGGKSEVIISVDSSKISGDDLVRALIPSIKAYIRKNGGTL